MNNEDRIKQVGMREEMMEDVHRVVSEKWTRLAGRYVSPTEVNLQMILHAFTNPPRNEYEQNLQTELLTTILELVEDHIVYANGRLHRLKIDAMNEMSES